MYNTYYFIVIFYFYIMLYLKFQFYTLINLQNIEFKDLKL